MSVFRLRSARAHTLPPRPPSPPSGPPRGTYFSRRKVAAPSPPLPACTSIFASSMNFIVCFAPQTKKPYRNPIGLCRFGAESRDRLRRSRLRGERNHAHGLLGRLALHGVLDLARDAGVEGMVAPH